jgi:hypothetical protein
MTDAAVARANSAAYLKFLHQQSANSIQELQIAKRHWNHIFASAHDFPKFVKGGC